MPSCNLESDYDGRCTVKILFLTVWLFGAILIAAACQAQPAADQTSSERQQSAAVILDGKQLFVIQTNLGPFSPKSRATAIVKCLNELLEDPDLKPSSLSLLRTTNSTDIVAGNVIIASVTDADAKTAARNRQELAAEYMGVIKATLKQHSAQNILGVALGNVRLAFFGTSLLGLLSQPLALKLITVIVGALIISILGWSVQLSLGSYVKNSSRRYASRKVVTFMGCFLIFILAIVVFKDALGNLALIVGAATAGIAFALKDVIVSVAGWLAVTFGDIYKVGDRIQVGAIKGDVIDIGFIRTTLMELGEWVKGDLYTGRIVRVANSFIFAEPMFNYSADFPYLWDEITIPIKYGSDYKRADELLKMVVTEITANYVRDAQADWTNIERKYLVGQAQLEPMVLLAMNDNWIEFTVRYTVQFKIRRQTRDKLFRRIMQEFDKTEGSVAIASSTFQLVGVPPIDVRINREGTADTKNVSK
jgi:small-conductance mechanosensitive channel